MLIPEKWSRFNWYNVEGVPQVYGAYELADGNDYVIYIGSGILYDRLSAHKRSRNPCLQQARKFRYEETKSKERAEQRERSLLREFERRYGCLPRCNERLG